MAGARVLGSGVSCGFVVLGIWVRDIACSEQAWATFKPHWFLFYIRSVSR